MAQRSIGLNIEILNEKRLTDVENKIKKLNENGLKIRVEGLDKLSNIQDLISNIGKVKEQLDSISKSGILNQNQIKNENQQIDETVRKLQQAKEVKGNMSKTSSTIIDGEEVKRVEQYNQIIGRTVSIIENMKKGTVTTTTSLDSDKIVSTVSNIQKAIDSAKITMDGFKAKNEQVFNSLSSDKMIKYSDSIANLKNVMNKLNNNQPVKLTTMTGELNNLQISLSAIKTEFNQGLINEKITTKQETEVEKLNSKLQNMIGTIRLIQQTDLFNNKGSRAVFNRASGNGLIDKATSLKIDTSNLEQAKKEVSNIEIKLKNLQTNSSRIISFEPLVNKIKNLRNTLGSQNVADLLGLKDTTELNNMVKKYTNLLNSLKNNSGDITKGKFDSIRKELQGTIKDVEKLGNTKNNLQSLFSNINKSKIDSSTLASLQERINSINTKTPVEEIKKLTQELNTLTGNSTKINALSEKLKGNQNLFNKLMGSNSKGLNTQESQKAIQQYEYSARALQNIMNNLSNGSAKYSQVQARVNTLNKQCSDSLKEMQKQMKATDNTQKGFGQRLNQMASSLGIYMSVALVMRRVFSSIREGINDVISLEDSMVSLQRVYNVTGQSVQDFQSKLVSTSRELGTSATDYIDTVTSFKKLGYDINEAQNLATQTTKFNLAGDINNMEQATSSVVSVLKGFKLEAKDVTSVVDAMNTASNEYAVSASDLADIMQKSSSSLSVYGNSLNESLALGTVANEIMQDSSKVGRALKTLSARIGQVKDGVPRFREELLQLTGNKVDIVDTNNELKSTYDIMKELGAVWSGLNSMQKSQIGNDLFGKDNITTGYAILENYQKLDQVVASLNNSTGSVDSEFNRYLDSTSGKIQQLKDAVLEMWSSFISSDTTKNVVERLTKLVDTFGNLGGVITIVTTAILVFKGKAIMELTSAFLGCIAGETALTTATFGLSMAFEKLKLAFLSNPLGILAIGLTTVVALMGQAKTSADRFNDSVQAFSKANDSFNTLQDNEGLVTQYEQLETRLSNLQSGTSQYTEVSKDLHDVQVKLAESFPELIDGFDEEGNALVRNTDKIKQVIKTQSQDTILEMQNAIKQTENVLKSRDEDYDLENLYGGNKYLKTFMDSMSSLGATPKLKTDASYEQVYKQYRTFIQNGQELTEGQTKLYEDSKEKLQQYNQEVAKLYAQTKDLDSVKEFKIFDFKEGDFVNAKTYFQELEAEQKRQEETSASMTAKIQAYAEQGWTASQISDKLGVSLETVTTAMSALGDETGDTTTAMKDLSDSYSDNVNKANLLQDVIEEFKSSGGLSLETKDKIFSSGYQDIIQAMGNSNTFLSTMESLLNDCMIEAEGLENKMLSVANSTVNAGEASNDMATNYTYNFNTIMKLINLMEDENAKELDSLAKQYNVDLKNKETAENEKAKLVNAILNGMDSSTATMLNNLGQKYGVDVDNFSKAQQAKIALLNNFTKQLAINTQDYSYVSGGKFSELKKKLEKEDKMASGAIPSNKYAKNLPSSYSPNKVQNTPIGTTGVSSSGGGSGSNGSSSTERDYSVENLDLKDYIENHYKLEDKIRDVQHQQDLLSKSIENTYGKNKVKLQNQYINKLKEEQNLQKQLLNEQKKELGDLQKELKGYNAHFDASGNIANMTELYYHWITIANSINDSTESGANSKKDAQEKVKYIKELVDKYRDLQEEIQSTESTFNDLSDSIKDVFQQMSDVCIEAEETIANAISEYIENIYDENTEVLDKLRDKIDKTFEEEEHEDTVADYQKQLLEIRGSIEDAMKTGNSSLVKQLQQEYEDVQKEYSDYMKNYEKDKALEKLDEEQEKLDKQKEDLLSSENLTKLITQAMSEGFINVNGTIVQLDTLMNDFTKNNTVGMQNLVNETNNWNETLMTAINTASQLSGINSSLGLNTTFTYTKAMQDSINQALKEVKSNSNTKNLNVTSPLVVIENVTSDNYNDIIDQVTSQIYNTLDKVIE